jgi:hypothetical protein
MLEVTGSNIGPETGYTDWEFSWFSSFPPGKLPGSILQFGCDRFLPSTFQSSFIYLFSIVAIYIVWGTEKALLNKLQTNKLHSWIYLYNILNIVSQITTTKEMLNNRILKPYTEVFQSAECLDIMLCTEHRGIFIFNAISRIMKNITSDILLACLSHQILIINNSNLYSSKRAKISAPVDVNWKISSTRC